MSKVKIDDDNKFSIKYDYVCVNCYDECWDKDRELLNEVMVMMR